MWGKLSFTASCSVLQVCRRHPNKQGELFCFSFLHNTTSAAECRHLILLVCFVVLWRCEKQREAADWLTAAPHWSRRRMSPSQTHWERSRPISFFVCFVFFVPFGASDFSFILTTHSSMDRFFFLFVFLQRRRRMVLLQLLTSLREANRRVKNPSSGLFTCSLCVGVETGQ